MKASILAILLAFLACCLGAPLDLDLDGRIVGGYRIPITVAPYQVSVQFNGVHLCGGAILQPDIVVTAAHCFHPNAPEDTAGYAIRAGSSRYMEGGQLVAVRRIKIYQGYSLDTLDGDITVLLLKSNLLYSPDVQPISLAMPGDTLSVGSRMYVSGWGLNNVHGQLLEDLNEVAVNLYPLEQCAATYRDLVTVTDNMFCAWYAPGGRDSCQGDSGGPIVSVTDGRLKLFGVVSWGIGCGDMGFPGVYARLNGNVLTKWLEETICEMQQFREEVVIN